MKILNDNFILENGIEMPKSGLVHGRYQTEKSPIIQLDIMLNRQRHLFKNKKSVKALQKYNSALTAF